MAKMLKVVGASWLQTKISSYILGVLGFLAILALFFGQMERIQEDGTYAATIFYSDKTGYRIEYWGQSNELANIPRGVARAYFRMDIDTTGWSTLEVETDESYPDEVQAYAAGIVEGALTWYLIHTHLDNTVRSKCENQPIEKQCDRVKDYLERSANVWKSYASEHEDSDPFWHQVSLYYTQINGIFTGWNHGVERSMNEFETDISDLYWLNAFSEIAEIQHKLNLTIQDPEIEKIPTLSSAFVKIVNETFDEETKHNLFVAQNAADSYSTMMRILKRYKLNYHETSSPNSPPITGNTIDFSGYPGSITSQDEFYIIRGDNHKLAVTGTSLKNYNENLWKDVDIVEQIGVGPRVAAANRLSSNVSSWAYTLARSNSGTGAKQWMVVDFDKLKHLHSNSSGVWEKDTNTKPQVDVVTEISNKKNVKHTIVHRGNSEGHVKGLLWLIEQVPTRTHSADLSDVLITNGYWATYGIPMFKDVAEITEITKNNDNYLQKSNRGEIFKAKQENATTVEDIFKLMRDVNTTVDYNNNCDGKSLCLSAEPYWNTLGVRGDIIDSFKKPYGVIDTKIVKGDSNGTNLEFLAISSPPFTEAKNKTTNTPINKGNVATIYTDEFDHKQTIDSSEIQVVLKHQQEEAEKLSEEQRYTVQPFNWNDLDRKYIRAGLPDEWNFNPFTPYWAW